MNERQRHAFEHPVADPDEVSALEGGFRHQRRLASGVLITILTVNR